MSIKVKNSIGVIPVLVADNLLLTVVGKVGIEALNCHNTGTTDVTLTFYISPDLTSASGKKVSKIILPGGEDQDINAIIGQGYSVGDNIIIVADAVNVNCSMSYTQFTGNDV
ncbi:hypothetical protein KA005_30550 [bacterium]|nr:hypothetical protein [bacterium]